MCEYLWMISTVFFYMLVVIGVVSLARVGHIAWYGLKFAGIIEGTEVEFWGPGGI